MEPHAAANPTEPGLHLRFSDGNCLSLTAEYIETRAQALLADPEKIPVHVRDAEAFQLCTICPQQGSGDSCHAIRPIMTVWEGFEHYASHDEVKAVYRSGTDGNMVSADTTVQRALQYVSVLSLMYYCEVGKKYWRYFYGVHPLMATEDLVVRVYLNMFWACGGDKARTQALIETFYDEINVTTRCQMDRVRLFCHNDSLLNALILTELAAQFLTLNVEQLVEEHVRKFGDSFFT
jgi:hypothetical protein